MSREVLDARRRALRRAGRVALLRRGLPRARARPGRSPAGRVRPLRARAVARLDVEDLRAARPAARLARLPRPRGAAAHRRPQALHHDLLERAERAPQRARAPASRRRSPIATAASCSRTCRSSTAFFERHADLLSWVRPTAGPIGFSAAARRGRRDRVLRAAGRRRGSAAPARRRLRRAGPRPRRLRPGGHARGAGAARALHRHTFLTLRKRRRNPGARFPNILPIHLGADNTTPSRRGAAMGDGQRLTTWIEWYRFARAGPRAGPCRSVCVRHGAVRGGAEPDPVT